MICQVYYCQGDSFCGRLCKNLRAALESAQLPQPQDSSVEVGVIGESSKHEFPPVENRDAWGSLGRGSALSGRGFQNSTRGLKAWSFSGSRNAALPRDYRGHRVLTTPPLLKQARGRAAPSFAVFEACAPRASIPRTLLKSEARASPWCHQHECPSVENRDGWGSLGRGGGRRF